MHEIDLKKYELRTDLAIDLIERKKSTKNINIYYKDDIKITSVVLKKNNALKKKEGTYITLEFDDVTDDDNKNNVKSVFKEELLKILQSNGYNKDMKTLIIGLGNIKSTPDSLGPLVSDSIITTSHLYDMKIEVDKAFSSVCSFYPGVTGITGIETSNMIIGVVNEVKPDLIIVVDALSSTSISRVNKSIQITDSGISPGSGVGNKRKEISKDTIGVPVIAIGVPTVTSASVIVCDTIEYMINNYINEKKVICNNDRENLFGLIGTLSQKELENLTYEVLTPLGYNLMVTPKEVDFVIEKLSEIISFGINNTLHDIS